MIWNVGCGIWNLELGTWNLVFGIWILGCGSNKLTDDDIDY